MPSRQETVILKLEWNEQGNPVVELPPNWHLQVSVATATEKQQADPTLPEQSGEVSIRGNREGLIALAYWLLAVAHTDIPGYHQHFDQEAFNGHYHSEQDWWLTIGRNDKRTVRQAAKTIERMSDEIGESDR